ncbi:hypothetical protein ACH47Z_46450 [Streptomyces sp. NPDC020192]|uniref:hypothetical protein n=1 Tax=Streptomyces sp. NPDC020192 TaxID=3365066 RepID=UPI003789FE67
MCTWNTQDERGLIAAGTRHGINIWDSSGQQLVQINCPGVWDPTVLAGNSGRVLLAAATSQGEGVFAPLSGQRLAWLPLAQAHEVQVLREGFDISVPPPTGTHAVWLDRGMNVCDRYFKSGCPPHTSAASSTRSGCA